MIGGRAIRHWERIGIAKVWTHAAIKCNPSPNPNSTPSHQGMEHVEEHPNPNPNPNPNPHQGMEHVEEHLRLGQKMQKDIEDDDGSLEAPWFE